MSEIHLTDIVEQPVAAVRDRVRTDQIQDAFGPALEKVFATLSEGGHQLAGAPYTRYRGMPGDTIDVEIGFPVASPFAGSGDVVGETLPSGRAVEALHVGDYDSLRTTYEEVERWMREHHLTPAEQMWEIYEAGPGSDPDPSTWRTRIVWPITGPPITAS